MGTKLGYHSFSKQWNEYRETLKVGTGLLECHLKALSRLTYLVGFYVRGKDFLFSFNNNVSLAGSSDHPASGSGLGLHASED